MVVQVQNVHLDSTIRLVNGNSMEEPSKRADSNNNGIQETASLTKASTSEATPSADETNGEPLQCQHTDETPIAFVTRVLQQFHRNSKFTWSLCVESKPNVTMEELMQQQHSPSDPRPVLGEGGFSIVHAVIYNGRECAMKSIQPQIIQGPISIFKVAAADLLKEAALLSCLDHPGIVALHAKNLSLECLDENFIIIERLPLMLDEKMKEWREADYKARKSIADRLFLLKERLQVCLEISEVFKYLHENDLIYRDLKTANLGFDKDGKVKLFDFGLAKELKDDEKSSGGKYKLSGETGSLPYMAPEVAKGWRYNKMVDVYSFGILLWEIVALQPAFPNRSTRQQMHDVWSGDLRPPMADWWPVELQWLMKKCWAYFAKARPDFITIGETLGDILDDENKHEEEARGIKSSRLGSRRSQKLSKGADDMNGSQSLRPHHLGGQTRRKLFGLF